MVIIEHTTVIKFVPMGVYHTEESEAESLENGEVAYMIRLEKKGGAE